MKILSIILSLTFFFISNLAMSQTEIDDDDFKNPRHIGKHKGNELSDSPSGVTMELPSYVGTGCPSGSVETLLSGDKKTLSILFSEFIASAGDGSGVKRSISQCNLSIPFRVPSGVQVAVTRIDYRGYVFLDVGDAKAVYQTAYYLMGVRKNNKPTKLSKRKTKFVSNESGEPIDQDVHIASLIKLKRKNWSSCGDDFDLHIDSTLKAVSKDDTAVEVTLDSADLTEQGVSYHLLWKKCDNHPGQGKGKGRGKNKKNKRHKFKKFK